MLPRTVALAFVLSLSGWAQSAPPSQAQPHSPAPKAATTDAEPWAYNLTVDGYLIEGEDGYASPTFTADRNWLHLEARYNYENIHTGSLWMGYNFSWGKTWQFEVTPMIGGVFGRTNGIAPGCEASLSWKIVTLSIDNEYVFDTTAKAGNFYYSWPQLTFEPVSWFRFGGVAQRTKAFQTQYDMQRGFFVGFHKKLGRDHKQKIEFTTYIFDPGSNSTTVTLESGWSF